MGQFNFKNRIFAGPADGANCKPLLGEGKVAVESLIPGLAVTLKDGVVRAALDNNVDYVGAVTKEPASSRGGNVDSTLEVGELVEVIQPRSGDYLNILVDGGENIVEGTAIAASDTTAGLHMAVSSAVGDATARFVADETVGVLPFSTLVRCRVL